MSRILILANSSGGLYDFRNELLLRLKKQHEVKISVPDDTKVKELREEGYEVFKTPINRRGMNPKEDLKLFFSYRKLLSQVKPDLVLAYTIKPNIYGGIACRRKKIPYIATITGLGSTFQREGLLKKLIIRMYKTGLKRAACVFFQNEQNKGIFEKYGIKGKRSRLVNGSGVNLDKHTFEAYPAGGDTRFLFIGRIMREKGIEELLAAAEALQDERIVFEIMGYCDEDYQAKLDEYESRGLIKQIGFQPDVHAYIKAASAIILPTYHEGMSNVLMEAAATGRPVIATNISGCREIVEDGETGFLCEPQSRESLVLALRKFLRLTREEKSEMGRRAREKMEREFDRNKVSDVYLEEITEILQKR